MEQELCISWWSFVKNYIQEAHPGKNLPGAFFRMRMLQVRILGRGQLFPVLFFRCTEERSPRSGISAEGEKLLQEDMSITEVCIPVKEIHSRAKAAGVSITVFLTAALIWAIHEEVPQNQLKKPIGLMIPVNLRNYFPSQSMANFFGWIENQLLFSAGDYI